MLRFWTKLPALLLGLALLTPLSLEAAGKVFLVLGSDTALWNYPSNTPNTVDAYQFSSYFRPDLMISTNAAGYKVMDPAFRNRFLDSFGQPVKLTWWLMIGSVFGPASNLNVPIPNLMPAHLMLQYHAAAMRQFGDEIAMHYHTYAWNDPNGDGIFHWNQTRTFLEAKNDFDFTLAQYLLEEGIFPPSFRSGWHFMDQDWQAYLDTLLPYCLHDDYGVKKVWAPSPEPIAGVEDWSGAPSAFVPFHPATTNYQVPGDGRGWNVRSVKMQNLSSNLVNTIFAAAAAGTDQVACIWSHLPEDFLNQVAKTDNFVHSVATNYPAVLFRYCTATEAMQRWLGNTDQTSPELALTQQLSGYTVTLTLQTSEPIWQPQPFVAMKDVWEQYFILPCTNLGINTWTSTLPEPANRVAKFGVAVTDLAGNVTTRVVNYLPDNIYVDNLDPAYHELQGNWTPSTNAAWGTDSRIALLASNDTARAQWDLPISVLGRYQLAVQVPAVTNGAANLQFNLYSGGVAVSSNLLSSPLGGFQWLSLITATLDPTASNSLEMVVSGTNQANTVAVADVLRIAFVPNTSKPEILAITPASPGWRVQFAAQPGTSCGVQRSTDLESWGLVGNISILSFGVAEFQDTNAPPGMAFYRIVSSGP